ncbi:outer membrane protein assembly factor BamA [candidate division KSB1 bacterium]|nr:outer membrane protein assembly factor BamA [candidate division KSB1 bacterium]
MNQFILKTLLIYFCLFMTSVLFAQDIRVEDLQFKGNKKMSSGKLKKAIQTQANPWYRLFLFWMDSKIFNEQKFLNDLLRVEKFYEQEGFLEARVTDYQINYNEKREEVKLVIFVDEGEQTKVNSVLFVYPKEPEEDFSSEKMLKTVKLKEGKRYRESDLKTDYSKIMERFSNRGYPYIEARVKPIMDKKNHLVNLEWQLNPGPFCTFGEIKYTGNNSVSNSVIRRGLGFRPGQTFAHKKLLNAQSQVYRLELFQFVSLRATNLEQQPSKVPIEVRVKESVLRTLKFGAGYGSEERFRTFLQWRHRNFLGGARILRAKAKHSTRLLPVELELELSQPYFLDNQNDLIIKPFFIIQDELSFKARRIGIEIGINRQITSKTNLFVSTRVERDTVDLKGTTIVPEVEDLYSKSILKLGFRRSTTNALFSPTRGSISTFVIEDAGRFLKTKFEYIKLSAEHKIYHQSRPGEVLALRLFAGTMNPRAGQTQIPPEERFFSGGSFSVRGWQRQLLGPVRPDSTGEIIPDGGNSIIEGSLELRKTIFKKFSGVMFLDFGNVWPEWNGFDFSNLHSAIGGGLRYDTVIGPIRIDFAWKVNRQEHDTRNYEIHFSIGQAF